MNIRQRLRLDYDGGDVNLFWLLVITNSAYLGVWWTVYYLIKLYV